MKRQPILITCLLGLTLPLIAAAQSSTSLVADTAYGQAAGTREVTLGGSGSSNRDLDDSAGSIDFSYGAYLSPRSQWVFRQSATYVNPDNADSGWAASSRLGYNYHLSADGKTRPYLGVNAGRIYGDTVADSWTAGLEAGAKVFVKEQTFIYAAASYDWLFDRGSQAADRFDDGRLGWNLGIGYQF